MRRTLLALLTVAVSATTSIHFAIDPIGYCPFPSPHEHENHELCGPDDYPGDLWDGYPFVSGHYVLIPPATGQPPYPLLVLFRGAGQGDRCLQLDCNGQYKSADHWTPWEDGHLMQAASAQGWYAMSVLGAPNRQVNYGPPQGLLNTELAMREVLGNASLQIDPERVYAAGFSMGGASELAYLSRHLDPESDAGMFAAAVILSGATSNSYYWHNSPGSRPILQQMLALPTCAPGTPCDNCPWSPCESPFDWERSSGVFTNSANVVDVGRSIAQNLKHMPFWGFVDASDMVPNIRPWMGLLDTVMQGPNWHYRDQLHYPCTHCWDLYEAFTLQGGFGADIFTLLGGQTLSATLPPQARVLAADDSWYFHFLVRRRSATALGDFEWQLPVGQNQLRLRRVDSNVESLRVRTLGSPGVQHHSGLDPAKTANPLQLVVEASAAEPLAMLLDVTFEGYLQAPTSVIQLPNTTMIRDVHWFWSDADDTLRLRQRPISTTKTWVVTP